MYYKDKFYLIFVMFVVIFNLIGNVRGQNFWKITQVNDDKHKETMKTIIWCTISREEQQKCQNFAMAVERDQIKVGTGRGSLKGKIECMQAYNKNECMQLLDEEKATLTTLDAGAVFNGGRYYSLVPIAQELLEGGFNYYYAVAVIKKGTLADVNSLYQLREKKACFAGVETFAGWILPINTLMKEGGMEIIDCNNHVKSATNYFGSSCAVNCLTDKYNPIGDNSDKLCKLCIGKIPGGRCTDSDPYAGYNGAFRCLLEAGEIAFLKHNTVQEHISGMDFTGLSSDNFELLCKDGTRRPLTEYMPCNWGKVPSDAVVTSSAVSFQDRDILQKFLKKFAEKYPKRLGNATFGAVSGNQLENKYDQYGNKIQPEYDQFGNRIQPEYDPFGNRNRYKRQNFGNLGSQGSRTTNNDEYGNPYRQDNSNRDYNPYSRDNQYNSNQYGGSNQDDNQYNNQRERYTAGRNDPGNPFDRNPQILNPDQYGVNVDPYDTDIKYRKPTDPLYESSTESTADQTNSTFYEVFSLFESVPRYGRHGNLLFQDAATSFTPILEPQQSYTNFLGESLKAIMGVRDCPVNRMTLCVTSDAENNKCVKMRTALKAQLIKPEMDCYKGHSQIHCMEAIRAGTADVTILDASDVYTAGLNYDLVPFISEVYNLDEPEYYVVAVAKESDPTTELTYLKNKNTCHGGINTAAGWVYPLAFLISNGWIRPYGCNSIRAAAEYFTKSCVPGALSTEYNTGVPYDNMCDLCHGPSFRYCRRDASEDYYGHTGAFRCLVEGGGHVAFVKHTTVTENTGGKKKEWWTRDNLNDDYELLCPDGTRAEIHDYKKCNLGKVKANAIVTRGGYGYNETHINAFINLFMYAQTFYGRKISDEFSFSMFYSKPPYSDLIFQDATTRLKIIDPDKRSYDRYLGGDFLRARRIVDCHAGATSTGASIIILTLSALFSIVILRS
ncbi:melanotransferrin [Anoplophora glabripennis]|nr:melanotransferrin [Anoplophora glabripennis]